MTLHKLAIDLTGKVYGLLTVTKLAEERIRNEVTWECVCRCGKTTTATASNLNARYKQSCGCLKRQPIRKQPILGLVKSITITNPWVVNRVVALAIDSGTNPSTWVSHVLEDWILKHRSGRFVGDPDRHTERNDDTTHIYHD